MHDVNGAELRVGDRVLVEMKITSVSADQDFCNVQMETVHKMPGNGLTSCLTLNTKQVGVPLRAPQTRYCKHCPFAEHVHSPDTNAMTGCSGFEADPGKV